MSKLVNDRRADGNKSVSRAVAAYDAEEDRKHTQGCRKLYLAVWIFDIHFAALSDSATSESFSIPNIVHIRSFSSIFS